MSHPRHELDETIHSPVRFSIVATLAAQGRATFDCHCAALRTIANSAEPSRQAP